MSVERDIRKKLTEAFAPAALEVVNDFIAMPGMPARPEPGRAISPSKWCRRPSPASRGSNATAWSIRRSPPSLPARSTLAIAALAPDEVPFPLGFSASGAGEKLSQPRHGDVALDEDLSHPARENESEPAAFTFLS